MIDLRRAIFIALEKHRPDDCCNAADVPDEAKMLKAIHGYLESRLPATAAAMLHLGGLSPAERAALEQMGTDSIYERLETSPLNRVPRVRLNDAERAHMLDSFTTLPLEQQRVIALRDQGRMQWSDVAARMELSIEDTQRLWGKALTNLRRSMIPLGGKWGDATAEGDAPPGGG